MGYIKHEAVIVTADHKKIEEYYEKAKSLGCLTSEIVKGAANGTSSFFVAPDGSKEGWDTSSEHQLKRDELVAYLKSKDWGVDFVQITFGGDDRNTPCIIEHSK